MTAVNTAKHRAQDNFRLCAKTRLLQRGWTITQLAQRVGASRTAVSMAINQGLNRGVRKSIARELGL